MRRPRGARRWWWIGALSVGVIAVVGAAWLGWRVWTVKSEMDQLVPLAGDARAAIDSGDLSGLSVIAPEMAASARRAAGAAADPLWLLAEGVPVVGPNLTATRVVAIELARIADTAPGMLALVDAFDHRPAGAVVDTARLAMASAAVTDAARSLAVSAEALDALATGDLIAPVARGVAQAQDAVDALAPVAEVAAGVARILPAVLGDSGERSILVMVLNPAELRTGGGISGSFVELRAEQGALTLVRQADSSEFPPLTTSIAELPAATTTLYGDGVGRFIQNTTMTPDFSATGRMASAWWSALTGRTPDLVLAVDPYVLRALLAATGSVQLPSGAVLDADGVLDELLVEPYRSMTADEQTSLFSSAAEAVFTRVASGVTDPLALLRGMEQPLAEGRISAWSAHPEEQRLLEESMLGGARARQDAAGPGTFAVYFNDATGGKMAGYLDVGIDARVVGCRTDDIAEVSITLTMGSHAPTDVGLLPISVTGGGLFGVADGDIGTNVAVSAPRGSFVGEVIVKGERYPAATAIDDDHATSTARVNLSPDEVNVLEFHFLVPRAQADALAIVHTPLMNPADVHVGEGCPATVSP